MAPDGRPLGDLVVGRIPGSGPRLLLIGHMDTVFEPGTAAARPFRVEGDRGMGPGVSDMKGGLLAGLAALSALAELGHRPAVTFVANPDEEIGSPVSGPVIRSLAADHDAALVLECARANGDIVSARKGIAEMAVTIHGRAAHAGIEPEKGRSAILAAARMVEALHALNGRWPTVTCNVGVIGGGTRPNVVPETCRLEVDLRAANASEFAEAEEAVDRIVAEPALADTVAEHHVVASHQPMEKSPASARLVELAQAVAAEIGFTVGTPPPAAPRTPTPPRRPAFHPRRTRPDRRRRPRPAGVARPVQCRSADDPARRTDRPHRRGPLTDGAAVTARIGPP